MKADARQPGALADPLPIFLQARVVACALPGGQDVPGSCAAALRAAPKPPTGNGDDFRPGLAVGQPQSSRARINPSQRSDRISDFRQPVSTSSRIAVAAVGTASPRFHVGDRVGEARRPRPWTGTALSACSFNSGTPFAGFAGISFRLYSELQHRAEDGERARRGPASALDDCPRRAASSARPPCSSRRQRQPGIWRPQLGSERAAVRRPAAA